MPLSSQTSDVHQDLANAFRERSRLLDPAFGLFEADG